jgi:hypothetical protein
MTAPTPIPAVWRIDVEPDEFEPQVQQKAWQGFVAMADLVERLRGRLADRSGYAVRPTWFVRFDPDIERCFGQADFVVRRHHESFDRLFRQGDPFGIHIHPMRWDGEKAVVFSDHADSSWTTHCLKFSVDAFASCFRERVRRSSQGGYFLSESLLDAEEALGIEVDVTVEAGLAAKAADPSFGAYATAPSADFLDCPRQPYYPSRGRFGVPSSRLADARPILIVPLTAYDYDTALMPWRRRASRKLLRTPRRHLPLNPWKRWPSPKIYWDLVARAVDEQPARYFAFAVRTDAPGSAARERARELLEYLPSHPIAKRLQFVDPLGPEIRALVVPFDDTTRRQTHPENRGGLIGTR